MAVTAVLAAAARSVGNGTRPKIAELNDLLSDRVPSLL